MILVAPPGAPQHDAPLALASMVAAIVIASAAVYVIAGRESITPERRLGIGFAYQIELAFIVAFARHFTAWAPGDGYREISTVSIIIVVFAALIPGPPHRTLIVSLVAAAMDPLALALNVWRGNPAPPLIQFIAISFTPFPAAAVATIISRVVYGLSSSVSRAREMGSYRLVERLGEGGMGEVWRAEHRFLARPAAIKLIRADALDDVAVKRFEREAQSTAALRSPHTVQLYDYGVTDDGTFYYVMELLDGLDLDHLVETHGPMPTERAVHVLLQICASLDEAHHRGLIHRDIKPANIYLCRLGREDDFVKVLDFGLVKPKSDAGSLAVTAQGTFAGTPAFIAPEVVVSESEVDARADIYSLGCVAYWLLTGKFIFDTTSGVKMVFEHVHSRPPPPSSRTDRKIPEELERIVLQCLEKDPADRPASCETLRARLARVALDEPWTDERARAWWSAHAHEEAKKHATAPTVPSG